MAPKKLPVPKKASPTACLRPKTIAPLKDSQLVKLIAKIKEQTQAWAIHNGYIESGKPTLLSEKAQAVSKVFNKHEWGCQKTSVHELLCALLGENIPLSKQNEQNGQNGQNEQIRAVSDPAGYFDNFVAVCCIEKNDRHTESLILSLNIKNPFFTFVLGEDKKPYMTSDYNILKTSYRIATDEEIEKLAKAYLEHFKLS